MFVSPTFPEGLSKSWEKVKSVSSSQVFVSIGNVIGVVAIIAGVVGMIAAGVFAKLGWLLAGGAILVLGVSVVLFANRIYSLEKQHKRDKLRIQSLERGIWGFNEANGAFTRSLEGLQKESQSLEKTTEQFAKTIEGAQKIRGVLDRFSVSLKDEGQKRVFEGIIQEIDRQDQAVESLTKTLSDYGEVLGEKIELQNKLMQLYEKLKDTNLFEEVQHLFI